MGNPVHNHGSGIKNLLYVIGSDRNSIILVEMSTCLFGAGPVFVSFFVALA